MIRYKKVVRTKLGRTALVALGAFALMGLLAPPANAEVSGISAWVISGATGQPDPSAVSENQIQFGIGFSDSAGASDVRFDRLSFGYTVTGGGRTIASGSSNPNITYVQAGTATNRYIEAVDLRDLSPGTTYTISVWAVDHGQRFTNSINVTTKRQVTPPGAPTSVSAVAATQSATISWTSPASDGGAPITSHTATASPGGQSCTTGTTSCVVSSLSAGSTYTFAVTASNSAGTSSASVASATITIPTLTASASPSPSPSSSASNAKPASSQTPSPSSSASNAKPASSQSGSAGAEDLGSVDPTEDTIDGEIRVAKITDGYRVSVDTNSPDTPFTIVGRKANAKVLKWSLNTKTTGAVLFTTKMNISGYTLRLRMEGETLDVIKVA